ncbi:MAG: PepSY domain-containing protein [Shewanella sp.]
MTRKPATAPHKLKQKRLRQLRAWHRRLGVLSCLFILLLVVTGVGLNHSAQWQLGKSAVLQPWLLDYYGIAPPRHLAQFGEPNSPLLITDNRLWLGKAPILEAQHPLISAAYVADFVLAIDAAQLYLFDREGRVQDTQGASTGLPAGLVALGLEPLSKAGEGGSMRVWLKTAAGYLYSDEQLLEWTQAEPLAAVAWVTPAATVDPQWLLFVRGSHLSWERVLLDVHSGRLFGAYAMWLWDVVGFALALLALSGLWLWLKK